MSARAKSFLIISLALFVSSSYAADFTVTRVIRIGEGKWSIIPGQIKFSPDGSHVSFLNGPFLMVADSTGVASEVMTIQGRLLAYEWLTDSQIVALESEQLAPPRSLRRLSLVNISIGFQKVIGEYVRHSNDEAQKQNAFEGLYKTPEGMVYTKSPAQGLESIRVISQLGKLVDVGANRFNRNANPIRELVWGKDGLYLKILNTGDSTRIGPRPTPNYMLPPVWDPEMNYAMVGGTILRIADSTFIVLDTMLGPPPQGTLRCGIELPSLNPRFREALFNLVCYGYVSQYEHEPSIELDHVGLFDLESNSIIILDTLIGVDNCSAPFYSPDGKSIALLADGIVYIVRREFQK